MTCAPISELPTYHLIISIMVVQKYVYNTQNIVFYVFGRGTRKFYKDQGTYIIW